MNFPPLSAFLQPKPQQFAATQNQSPRAWGSPKGSLPVGFREDAAARH